MALTNPFAIAYGGLTVGGSSNVLLLHGPYVIERGFTTFRLVFDVICVATNTAGLASLAQSVETAFSQRNQSVVLNLGGVVRTYQSGQDILNVVASVTKSGDTETDRGVSRAYTVTIEAEMPASDRNGLREISATLMRDASQRRAITIAGVYTSNSGSNATQSYLSGADGECNAIVTALGGGATYEMVDEEFTRDTQNHVVNWRRQYVEILYDQTSGGRDSTAIREHSVTFTDTAPHPGDGAENIQRLRRAVGTYSCSVDGSVPLRSLWQSQVRPFILSIFSRDFQSQVFAVEDSVITYDETSRKISGQLKFVYQPSGASQIVEVEQSVTIREQRQIDYTPIHGGNELDFEADRGWALLERDWARSVIVVGEEAPRRRLGERGTPGTAGDFPDIGGLTSVDQRNDGNVSRDGWNVVANTSSVSGTWVGDSELGQQMRLTMLVERVTERFHQRPGNNTSSG
jgi:hypothetical protein